MRFRLLKLVTVASLAILGGISIAGPTRFKVTDPQTGHSLIWEGQGVPTGQELEQLFAAQSAETTFGRPAPAHREGTDRFLDQWLPSEGAQLALLLAALWSLWYYHSRSSKKHFGHSGVSDVYVKSNCRVCGGSIEFPAHGLGEWIDCPHCNASI